MLESKPKSNIDCMLDEALRDLDLEKEVKSAERVVLFSWIITAMATITGIIAKIAFIIFIVWLLTP